MMEKYILNFMVSKQAVIGLGLISMMFASTIAFIFIQVPFFLTQNQQQETSLPTEKIITITLTPQQETFLQQSGFTIMTLRYNLNCADCLEVKNLAETIVLNSEFSDQLYLVELEDDKLTAPFLSVRSLYGARELSSNITKENIINVLCSVVARPPLSCIGAI